MYTGCLAEAAYFIESNGEIAIIDPLRETQQYIKKAEKAGARIKYIFETHFHADFVSGHLDLSKKTGAKIVYGPNANANFEYHEGYDGEEFTIGDVTIKLLHTPGHTLESSTFLLKDKEGKNHAIFTGDTLFLGDVGRPDLAIKSNVSKEDLAAMLFDSLRSKILPLEDDIMVYPAHGAGSACGKNMSAETTGVLGEQKRTNYALRADMSKEEFVKEVLEGILPPPQYFSKNAMLNKTGASNFEKVLEKGNIPLSPDTFESIASHEGALVLDVRHQDEFAKRHIPGSILISLDGQFAPWAGTLITDINQPIVLITTEGREGETITRLSRVGYDNVMGYLEGGIQSWVAVGKHIASVHSVSTSEFAKQYQHANGMTLMDVRKKSEYDIAHVAGAVNFPLDYINDTINTINKDKACYMYCKSGYRSMTAISILLSRYNMNLINIAGGFDAISTEENLSKTDFVSASTIEK